MLALYIIGGLLLALFLLTLPSLRVDVSFREEFSLTVGYLFLRFPILPAQTKEEEEPPPQEKKGTDLLDKLKVILRREGFWGFVQSLADFLKLVLEASGRLLTHLRMKRFDLYLCLGGAEDAASAAVQYGQVSGAVYSACGLLFSLLPCKRKGVSVDLDYSTLENRVDFSGRFTLRPLFIIVALIRILIGAVPFLQTLRGKGRPGTRRKAKDAGRS